VLPVAVPALRERGDDVALLLREFASRAPHALVLDEIALRELVSWSWPGNVRQLRNFVERAKALGLEAAMRSASPTAQLTDPPPASTSAWPAAVQPLSSAPPSPSSHPAAAPFTLEPRLASLVLQPFREFREAWTEEGERFYLRALLAEHRNDAVAVAKAAGVDKSYIYKMLRRLNLQT
jgi:DNA-binding NtrC family response regulator